MKRLIEQRYLIRRNILTIVGIGLFFYFSYHILMGQRSYFRLMGQERQLAAISSEYDSLRAQRKELEERVIRMRPGSLDKDLLEERVQIVLGYYHPDEHILLTPR